MRKHGSRLLVRALMDEIDNTVHRAPWLDENLAAQLGCANGLPSLPGKLHLVRVRVAPGARWQGPYFRCPSCGTQFHREGKALVADA